MYLITANQFLYKLAKCYDFLIIEQRGAVQRFNSKLVISVFNEDNAKHNRPHGHILLNNRKIGEIYLDTWEIIDRNGTIDKSKLKEINEWLATNKHRMIEEWNKCNHKFEFEFNIGYRR